MHRILLTFAALAVALCATADPGDTVRAVDLRDTGALEKLKDSNPAHFEKIERILTGLDEQPGRAEAGWLEATFAARDVALSRLLIRTSYPPKQLLEFTLDDTRYTVHITRSDLGANVVPVR